MSGMRGCILSLAYGNFLLVKNTDSH